MVNDTAPITSQEMMSMFGKFMPIEAVNLLWMSPAAVGEVRAKLRDIAERMNTPKLLETRVLDLAAEVDDLKAKIERLRADLTWHNEGDDGRST